MMTSGYEAPYPQANYPHFEPRRASGNIPLVYDVRTLACVNLVKFLKVYHLAPYPWTCAPTESVAWYSPKTF